MARNRAGEDRETKRVALVDAAARLFLEQGYEATSMAELARAAGVAPNTIYWYFDDKDGLLIAVLDRQLGEAMRALAASAPRTLQDRLLDVATMIDAIERLMVAVHARVARSPALRDWHDQFHAAGDALMLAEIRAHLAARGLTAPDDATLAPIPRLWSYVLEGMVSHALPEDERRALCALLVEQLDALARAAAPQPS